MLKKWRINRLKVNLAIAQAKLEIILTICNSSETTAYYINKLIETKGYVAGVKERLKILEAME